MSSNGEVWLRTVPDDKGRFHAELSFGDDLAVTLTPALAGRWAAAVLMAVSQAEHDAAIRLQILDVLTEDFEGDREAAAAETIGDVRAARQPIGWPTRIPAKLEPGVGVDSGKPFLHLWVKPNPGANGWEPIGQWSVEDARGHALAVLEVAAVAELDTSYRNVMVLRFGVDPERALNVVGALGQYRVDKTRG